VVGPAPQLPTIGRNAQASAWELATGRPYLQQLGDLAMQLTHNTLSENIRAQSVKLLNKHLAAAIDLHAQLKQAHWNVRGPGFIAVHELFDKISEEVETYSDLIAERAGGLGGTAHGSIQVAAEHSFLVPYPLGIADEKQHVFAVSGSLAAFGQSVREAIGQATTIGDVNTADLFTQISRGVDQQLWFVESHIAPQKADAQPSVTGGPSVSIKDRSHRNDERKRLSSRI
jgi:starvation-inducible DNA-binding protein